MAIKKVLLIVILIFVVAGLAAATPAQAGEPVNSQSGLSSLDQPLTEERQAKSFWTPGDKQAVGTAFTYDQPVATTRSKVWFAITHGAITDILYPTADQNNVRALQLIVSDGQSFAHAQITDMDVRVDLIDKRALAWRITSRDPAGRYQVVQEALTDPQSNTVLVHTTFEALHGAARDYQLYLHYQPYLKGSGLGDQGAIDTSARLAHVWDGEVSSVLSTDVGWLAGQLGQLGESDGLTTLRTIYRLRPNATPSPDGHVAVTLQLPTDRSWTAALAFGRTEGEAITDAQSALAWGFASIKATYIRGWQAWTGQLDRLGGQATDLYYLSAMLVKAHEDKTHRGAILASISTPWGQKVPDEPGIPGYRRVWARDLYHAARSLIAVGDKRTPQAILAYLDDKQQLADGSFPQNSFVDGRRFLKDVQADQTAAPILLAGSLGATERYASLVKPAAEAILRLGPETQERWEQYEGYSPASLAAQVAALVIAGDMARQTGDADAAEKYLTTADRWRAQIATWTFTTNGPLGNQRYFMQLTNGDPDTDDKRSVMYTDRYDQRAILDVSFLELVRLGVLAPNDPHIIDSLPEVDAALRVETPQGPGWYRYTYDRTGEPSPGEHFPGKGRLWPLLTGERGMYELAAGRREEAQRLLKALEAFASPSGMLAEQVWEETVEGDSRCAVALRIGWQAAGAPCQVAGMGTGSSTPLVWAHSEYILLLKGVVTGQLPDRPTVVWDRYK